MSSAPEPKTFVCVYCEKEHNDKKQLVEHLDLSSDSNCSIVKDFLYKLYKEREAAREEKEEKEKESQVEEKRNNPEDHPLFGLQPAPLTRQRAICHRIYSEKAKDGSDCYYYYDNNGDIDDDSGSKLWYCKDCKMTFPLKAMMEIHITKKIISDDDVECNIEDNYLFQYNNTF